MQFLKNLNKIILGALVILLPISVSSLFANTFDFPKVVVLAILACLAIIVFAIEIAIKSKAEFKISNIDLPLFIFVLSFIISGIVSTQNKAEAFIFPGLATSVSLIFISYLLIKKSFSSSKESLLIAVTVSSTIVSLISIFSFLGVLTNIPQLPAFIKNVAFSTFGGKLPETIFLISTLLLNIYLALSEKELVKKIFFIVSSAIVILAIVLGISTMLPGKPGAPVLADFGSSWWVAVETLKTSPIFGVGTGNYLTAFNKSLPVSHNLNPLWSLRFTTGRSFVLTLITENGLLGLSSFFIVMFFIVKNSVHNLKKIKDFGLEQASTISLLIVSVIFFIYPINLTLLLLFFVLICLAFANYDLVLNLSATAFKNGGTFISKVPAVFVGIIILIGMGFLIFFGGKSVLAERKYKLAIDALIRNDGKATYDHLRQAIATNQYIDKYHATYAQVNLALARAIAQKKDVTETEKNTVAQLIQQAIREAKSTVTLNPQRAGNWEILASTYTATIPFAQGADNFAIQSYLQAISLDPINPNLRIALGGVYYSLGRYDEAIGTFKLAILAKQDLANAHYNLAVAYREKKDINNAIKEMEIVLNLVGVNSSDYKIATTELNNLKSNKISKDEVGENLNPPLTNQQPNINPPLELPIDANPPTTQ
ncbi:MAG TPA: tetratricopeptide repeat protein [Patescibacteria group bacterium]|nr:tetratricopeptide repeat protein [Patescibacteria group bacterium]